MNYTNKIIGNILGKKPKKDKRSKNFTLEDIKDSLVSSGFKSVDADIYEKDYRRINARDLYDDLKKRQK